MLNLNDSQKQTLVDAIRPNFLARVQRYDSHKYPEAIYQRLRIAFHSPQSVKDDDIGDAFIWKYGHWHKSRYPDKHNILIGKIQKAWPDFSTKQVIDAT